MRLPFKNYYDRAKDAIASLGITPEQMATLLRYGLFAKDNVTGFYEGRSGEARYQTALDAIAHVQKTGEICIYMEVDLRNLSGINEAIGHTKANDVFKALTEEMIKFLTPIASETLFFRHGGDELSAFFIDTSETNIIVAMELVNLSIRGIAHHYNLTNVKNPKGGKPGIGLHYGTVVISMESMPIELFQEADSKVCVSKKSRAS